MADKLIKKRGYAKQKITKHQKYIENYVETNADNVYVLRARLPDLEKAYREFCEINTEILEVTYNAECHCEEGDQIEQQFYQIKSLFLKCMDIVKTIILDEKSNNHNEMSQVSVKLPQIKIPHFTGEYSKWITFRDMFTRHIHENSGLPDVSKFHYLIGYLKEDSEPYNIVIKSPMSDAGYKRAWQDLNDRYNNSRMITKKYLNEFFSLPNVKVSNSIDLRRLVQGAATILANLKLLDHPTEHWDTIVVHVVSSKLDIETMKAWELGLGDNSDIKWDDMFKFLTGQAQALENVEKSGSQRAQEQSKSFNKKSNVGTRAFIVSSNKNSNNSRVKVFCTICRSENHFASQCEPFLQLSPDQRVRKVIELKLCINCLRSGHKLESCFSRKCSVCNQTHHSLLHNSDLVPDRKAPDKLSNSGSVQVQSSNILHVTQSEFSRTGMNPDTGSNSEVSSVVAHSTRPNEVMLATAIVLIEDADGNLHHCRALLDSASQSNFITGGLAGRLGLHKILSILSISGINESSSKSKYRVSTTIHAKNGRAPYKDTFEFHVVLSITGNLPSQRVPFPTYSLPKYTADPEFHNPAPVDLLLGAHCYYDILLASQLKIANELPAFIETRLGYIVGGKITKSTQMHVSVEPEVVTNDDLHAMVAEFFKHEQIESKPGLTSEEKQCEELFAQTTTRDNNGRYIVRLPLRINPSCIGETKANCIKRFQVLERRFRRDPDLKQQYADFIKEYVELRHMYEYREERNETMTRFYLPHHAVQKPDSTTTKTRVVFDASSKSSTGIALNDILLTGPTIQDDLFTLVLRFRKHLIGVTGDIAKMYRQIGVVEDQHPLQLIVWREHEHEPLKTFALATVTYGTTSASYLATRVLKQISLDEGAQFPSAAEHINDFYMDDLLTGTANEADAVRLLAEMRRMLEKGGMQLRKIASNSKAVLSTVPEEDKEQTTSPSSMKLNETIKTLGLTWNPASDQFLFNINVDTSNTEVTKRLVLSEIAHIFDPIGLLGPIIALAKIFLQGLWSKQLKWDDPLPTNEYDFWFQFRKLIPAIQTIRIPRCISSKDEQYLEIHGFADASQCAYGACLYLRSIGANSCRAILICSKSRVAPLKNSTIPRLELNAAVLLCRLLLKTLDATKLQPRNIILWSDSSIVLSWLQMSPRRLKTYVSNRVCEIQEIPVPVKWLHIPSEIIPADIISRGVMPNELQSNKLWWNGPEFLSNTEAEWPSKFSVQSEMSELPEIKDDATILHCREAENNEVILSELILKFSSFRRLLNVVGYCLRFCNNFCSSFMKDKKFIHRSCERLTHDELHIALLKLVKTVQGETFSSEIKSLKSNKSISKTSCINRLHPFMDEDGIIRVGGRLTNSILSNDEQKPILLPAKHRFTELLMQHEHVKQLHCGPQMLLAQCRQQFWPINGRSCANKIYRNCIECHRQRPRLQHQIMADLPAGRVVPSPPFTITGIDLCGPFLTRNQNPRSKAEYKTYVAVFICFSTKAVHNEIVSDLSTSSFLAALDRFMSTRGKPCEIHTDNALNFVGASNELKKIQFFFNEQANINKIQDHCNDEGIIWKFIPPRSPSFGGLWEAAIKSFKHHFRRITRNQSYDYERLHTLSKKIEACLNSRPITPLSTSPEDLAALTPGTFLIGRPLTAINRPNIEDIPQNRLNKWRAIEQQHQSFWNRWSKEYLNTLQVRSKWNKAYPELQVNDLVLIHVDNVPPSTWPLGRVLKVHPGANHHIRVVTLKTRGGIIQRAVTKLSRLPMEAS